MRLKPSVVKIVFLGHLRSWLRNRTTLFWTIAFPIILMLLFGAIFSIEQGKLDLYVMNDDVIDGEPSEMSFLFIEILNSTDAINVLIDDEITVSGGSFNQQGISRLLIIPEGFELNLMEGDASVKLLFDQSQSSSPIALSVITGVIGEMNTLISGSDGPLRLEEAQVLSSELRFIDFFLPGVIGIGILSTGVFGTIGTNTKYRKNGVLKKLATTPLSKLEWVSGMVFYQAFLGLISAAAITTVGIVVFKVKVIPNVFIIFLVFAGALTFSGLGMIITRIVREEEDADAAGNVVTFPMMFLSGTFFPLELMPPFLQIIARILPLTYLNNGLRDAMIFGNVEGSLLNGAVIMIIGIFFIIVGAMVTDWRQK